MRALLVAVGVCLLVCITLAAQGTPPPASGDAASKEVKSDATVAASPAPAATVMRLQPAPSGFASGPSGDLWMDGRSPFPAYGIQLVAHSPDTPDIVAKLGTADSFSWFDVDDSTNTTLMRVRGDGNVGIGTPGPNAKLSLGGGTGLKQLLYDEAFNLDYKMGLGVNLANPGVSSSIDVLMGLGTGTDNSFNVVKPTHAWPYYLSAYTKLLTVAETGDASIATVPASLLTVGAAGSQGPKLTVNGDVTVTGNLGAKFQDIAEWVPVTEPVSAGTVVVVSNDESNSVTPSIHAYDTRVAGVISAQPGLTLGEGSATKAKVATTGRVKVRVDASTHPIARGDLLVTSDKPGTAMFSEALDLGGVKIHRPGTLIGKALEPLAKGPGEILVLLSLQ